MPTKETIHQGASEGPKVKSKTSWLPRITYATLTITPADNKAYDQATERVRAKLGKHHANYIDGPPWETTSHEMAYASLLDKRITVSYFPRGTREDTCAAIEAARDAFGAWSARVGSIIALERV